MMPPVAPGRSLLREASTDCDLTLNRPQQATHVGRVDCGAGTDALADIANDAQVRGGRAGAPTAWAFRPARHEGKTARRRDRIAAAAYSRCDGSLRTMISDRALRQPVIACVEGASAAGCGSSRLDLAVASDRRESSPTPGVIWCSARRPWCALTQCRGASTRWKCC